MDYVERLGRAREEMKRRGMALMYLKGGADV